MLQRGFAHLLLLVLVVLGAAGVFYVYQTGYLKLPTSSRQSGQTIKVKLIDAYMAEPVANVSVKVRSDNGIRCIQAPCDTDVEEWEGKTDALGYIDVPQSAQNQNTLLTADGYGAGFNLDNAEQEGNEWVLEIDPDSKTNDFQKRLKLIDLKNRQVLADAKVWFTAEQYCDPESCANHIFSSKTNSLGNFYYSASVGRGGLWVYTKGYKAVPFPYQTNQVKIELTKDDGSISVVGLDPKTVKVGDRVGSMRVVSIMKAVDYLKINPVPQGFESISQDNIAINFVGQVQISGNFTVTGGGAGAEDNDVNCFSDLDEDSEKLMPHIKGGSSKTFLCFKETKMATGKYREKGTIIIDEYFLIRYPSEVYNMAKLVKVVSKGL